MSMEDANSTCDIWFLKKSSQNCKKLFFFLGTQCTIHPGEVFKLLLGFEMDLNNFSHTKTQVSIAVDRPNTFTNNLFTNLTQIKLLATSLCLAWLLGLLIDTDTNTVLE